MDKSDRTLISTLKGRISKVLNFAKTLTKFERAQLCALFDVVDKIILCYSDDNLEQQLQYMELLSDSSLALRESKKVYIRKHILPLVSKISTKRWGKNG